MKKRNLFAAAAITAAAAALLYGCGGPKAPTKEELDRQLQQMTPPETTTAAETTEAETEAEKTAEGVPDGTAWEDVKGSTSLSIMTTMRYYKAFDSGSAVMDYDIFEFLPPAAVGEEKKLPYYGWYDEEKGSVQALSMKFTTEQLPEWGINAVALPEGFSLNAPDAFVMQYEETDGYTHNDYEHFDDLEERIAMCAARKEFHDGDVWHTTLNSAGDLGDYADRLSLVPEGYISYPMTYPYIECSLEMLSKHSVVDASALFPGSLTLTNGEYLFQAYRCSCSLSNEKIVELREQAGDNQDAYAHGILGLLWPYAVNTDYRQEGRTYFGEEQDGSLSVYQELYTVYPPVYNRGSYKNGEYNNGDGKHPMRLGLLCRVKDGVCRGYVFGTAAYDETDDREVACERSLISYVLNVSLKTDMDEEITGGKLCGTAFCQ